MSHNAENFLRAAAISAALCGYPKVCKDDVADMGAQIGERFLAFVNVADTV
ncbi:MAG: hypothetical protein ACLVJ6_12635 [Merdibacter sp.]